MTEIVSFAARKWASNTDPNAYSPRDMLVEALRQVDAGDLDAHHMVLVVAHKDEASPTGQTTGYMQAGSYAPLAALGLLTSAVNVMQEP